MSEIINIDQSIVVKKIDKKTTNIQIFNNDLLQSIVGEFNGNLKKLEKTFFWLCNLKSTITVPSDSKVPAGKPFKVILKFNIISPKAIIKYKLS